MKIDTTQIETGSLRERSFPSAQKFRICISSEAHDTVWDHARESVTSARKEGNQIVEVGGILLGEVYRDKDGPFLEVSAAIVGEHTKNQGAQMTFTTETWAHVNRVKDERYPDARVVGWYHTHPRFGIFLSEMDRFIHKSHFPQPWTTALVVDPVQDVEGFFVWSSGEPRPVSEYWVGSQHRPQLPASKAESDEPPPLPASAQHAEHASGSVSRAAFAVVVAVVFLVVLFASAYFYMRETSHTETEADVKRTLSDQKRDLLNVSNALLALRDELEAARKQTNDSQDQTRQRIQQLGAELQKAVTAASLLEKKIAAQQEQIDRLQAPAGQGPKQGEALPEVKKP
jgi:proteasome lid subunit RPN8/RPN11/F0F1-type ATP synthase membrane subunit b/b'